MTRPLMDLGASPPPLLMPRDVKKKVN
jgi:hypothetical protein